MLSHMKQMSGLFVCLLFFQITYAQLAISSDKRHLVTNNGTPFFWLGDTVWELFHRTTREEATAYLDNRSAKGFTIIQAVVLAELDGLNTANSYGNKPLLNNDPLTPNEAYFTHVDFVVNEANKRGIIVALLPTWGDKWNKKWGVGPDIFTPANAASFGEYLGRRYKDKGVVWVLGGDRNPEEPADFDITRSLAHGLRNGDGGSHLMTYHPMGGSSSFDFYENEDWIDIHMSQTGHRVAAPNYRFNEKARALPVARPHIDGEPRYEDHPNDFNPVEKGWMDAFDTRVAAYWSMLSGAAGHTYGNHNIWQLYTENRTPINNARTHWKVALDQPGAFAVGWMRKMMEKRNWQLLQPAQKVIISENPEGEQYKVAAVSIQQDFMMVYIPFGTSTTINTQALAATSVKGWWFNPRDGRTIAIPIFENKGTKEFIPSSTGRGSDWLLILDDAAKVYTDPAVE